MHTMFFSRSTGKVSTEGTYLAFGYLSCITTKSSSYSMTLPSGFFSGCSIYTPRPSRRSKCFELELDGCALGLPLFVFSVVAFLFGFEVISSETEILL